ncbi:ABC transporter permease subunit [Aristaeella lactis]|jgi:putative multiple sugar transport system permease protein|uniref:Multiple sugar transport system permease protein n=1 Tax=Aristaeella lactis TaxID=3046383 RepID=A0AC61PPQ6_9FIRM|nr:sugar ABC transporter permease [Aristaeella lactis]SMC83424.1 putative multiple sugar transport system permease protein [Aristaeella lactis]
MSENVKKAPSLRELTQKYKVGEFFQKYTMVLALVLVAAFFALRTGGKTLLPANINNLIAQNAYVFVLAAGMLLCILTGGNIDLSVGSVVCFAAAVGTVMMQSGVNMWIAVLAMLAIGLAVGTFQGFWIAKLHVPAFIATLSGMYAFRGFSNVVLGGYQVSITNQSFLDLFGGGAGCYVPDYLRQLFGLANGKPNITCLVVGGLAVVIYILMTIRKIHIQKKLQIHQSIIGMAITTVLISAVIIWLTLKLASHRGIPTVMIWICLVLGVYQYITTRTAIGRHLYAVGGNEKATALSGVKTRNVFWFAYASIGLMAGLAGILTAARARGIDPTYGEGYEMDAIASCFIGGASAYGGIGKVSGMIIGAVLMGVINQGMGILGVDSNYQKVVKGIVLLVAVMFDVLSKRQKR